MPSTSKTPAQIAHYAKLNSLPQTASTRFKKGHPPRVPKQRIACACDNCGAPLELTPWRFGRTKKHFCGDACRNEGNTGRVTDRAVALYKSGMKLREIVAELAHTPATTASLLYRRRKRVQFVGTRQGWGKQYVKSHLPKSCELCGYSRFVELAHIVPVRAGGKNTVVNCYSLCPNCHRLFDNDLLSDNEQAKLKEVHASRIQ